MEFAPSDEQQAIADLAAQIFSEQATTDRLKEIVATDDLRFDRALWSKLADANLLGVCVPEELGGLGFGLVELCLVLQQLGRTVAPVPLLATLAYGALPLARFGSTGQAKALLPGVVGGETVLTGAFVETPGDPRHPSAVARASGGAWTVTGTRPCVPAGLVASHALVSASTADGATGLFLVDLYGPGVTREREDTTSEIPEALLTLDGAPAETVGPVDAAGTVLGWTLEHVTVALCAVQAGVTEGAIRLTAEYTTTREQFDRPIATFQAVGQRAADAYIDATAIRLTMLHAAWRLADGRDASKEVAVAKYFASEAAARVARAAQHLHGGMGVDRDYPLYRYYVWNKQLELTLGGASRQLVNLGRLLADEPVHA
ncbi:MAG: acyl-CoA dehydrogenase family protein [Acidimicrobiia bacterium]